LPEWWEQRIERRAPHGANLRQARALLFDDLRALRHVKVIDGKPFDCYLWLLAQILGAYGLVKLGQNRPRCIHGRDYKRCRAIGRDLAELKKLDAAFQDVDSPKSTVNRRARLRTRLTRQRVDPETDEVERFCGENDVPLPKKEGRPNDIVGSFILECCNEAFEGTKISERRRCDWACAILRFCFGYWTSNFRSQKFDDVVRRWKREKARVRKRGPLAGLGWPDIVVMADGSTWQRRL
jgi:hypothetical protein